VCDQIKILIKLLAAGQSILIKCVLILVMEYPSCFVECKSRRVLKFYLAGDNTKESWAPLAHILMPFMSHTLQSTHSHARWCLCCQLMSARVFLLLVRELLARTCLLANWKVNWRQLKSITRRTTRALVYISSNCQCGETRFR
jgi:hypothetical protein